MATLLDGILETHEGPEPRVVTEDVQRILARKVRPGDEDAGESVALIAERAGVSTRTVYRVLNPSESKPTISLDLGDRLCIAAGGNVSSCRLVWPDGAVTDFVRPKDGTGQDNLG